MEKSAEDVRYREVQHFRQPWVWILLIGIAALMWYLFFLHFVMGTPAGTRPAPDAVVLLFTAIFGIGFPLFFLVLRLEITVAGERLIFRFYPLQVRPRTVLLEEIVDATAETYHPLREFGGWGWWLGRRGAGYTVAGDRGVRVLLTSGKQFLLGSTRPEELRQALTGSGHGGPAPAR
jgi:hypothetical protein